MTETLQNMPHKDLFQFCSELEAVPCQLLWADKPRAQRKAEPGNSHVPSPGGGCPARVSNEGERAMLLTMRSISESRHGSQCIAGRERAWVCLSALQRGKSSFPPNCSSESLMLTPGRSVACSREEPLANSSAAPIGGGLGPSRSALLQVLHERLSSNSERQDTAVHSKHSVTQLKCEHQSLGKVFNKISFFLLWRSMMGPGKLSKISQSDPQHDLTENPSGASNSQLACGHGHL